MKLVDRRSFVKAASGALAGLAATGKMLAGKTNQSAPGHWKKAFMLGSVTKGPVLPTFHLLKEAGFEGVELISPNQLDQSEVLAARDKTGLVIHGVSGGRHWQDPLSDPDPKVVVRG